MMRPPWDGILALMRRPIPAIAFVAVLGWAAASAYAGRGDATVVVELAVPRGPAALQSELSVDGRVVATEGLHTREAPETDRVANLELAPGPHTFGLRVADEATGREALHVCTLDLEAGKSYEIVFTWEEGRLSHAVTSSSGVGTLLVVLLACASPLLLLVFALYMSARQRKGRRAADARRGPRPSNPNVHVPHPPHDPHPQDIM